MRSNLAGLGIGVGFGAIVGWAQLADPDVIRDMLLLRELHVFLLMGSSVLVAAIGVRLLRAKSARALVSGEKVGWDLVKPRAPHVIGSILFGLGWSFAGTCPGPAAVMIGQGRLAGLFVVFGLLVGVTLQPLVSRRLGTAGRAAGDTGRVPGL
jgi:uncharacterized membrane protein YedE/YeeE